MAGEPESPGVTWSAECADLFAAMARAQAGMKPLGKSKKVDVPKKGEPSVTLYSYHYADLPSTLAACLAAYNAEGCHILQSPRVFGNGVEVTTLITHSSGQWLMSPPMFMPVSTKGAQDVGSALTYARRYALQSIVGQSPADDNPDPGDDDGGSANANAPDSWDNAKPRIPDLGPRCTGQGAPIATANKGYVEALAAHAGTDPAAVWVWAVRKSGIDCTKYAHELPLSAELTTADGLVVKAVLKLEAGRKGVDDAGPDGES